MIDIEKAAQQKLSDTEITVGELQQLIEKVVEQKLSGNSLYMPSDTRSTEEILRSMWENIIKPEPGIPSALELLREERDQWYKPS